MTPLNRLRATLREPLLHFLVLGAAIYGVAAWVGPDAAEEADSTRITVTASQIAWLETGWQKRWNRPPTPEERAGLIREYVRETVLYREALAMGLDRDDTIVRRRLAQKLEFLTQDLADSVEPTEEELRAFHAEHAERYQLPGLTTLTQVFVDPDRRGQRAHVDAAAIGAALRAQGAPNEESAGLGDPFMLQSYYPERSERELAKLFGSGFADQVVQLEPGRWHGPLLSGYGMHWVWVERRSPPVDPGFVEVREKVRQDLEGERRERFNEEYYAALLDRYEVVIEDEAADGDYAAASGDEL